MGDVITHTPFRIFMLARFHILLLMCLPLTAGIANAEPTAKGDRDTARDGDGVKLEPMQVTATRQRRSTHDTAIAVTVVDGEAGRDQQTAVTAAALRGVVGAFFQQTTPGQGIPILRGLKGSQVLHLVDGMRLNNAFFRNAPNQYLGLVDAYNIDHYEVVRGPSSTLYGGDAMGGVVQMITPESRFHGDAWSGEAEIHTGFASADLSELAHARLATGRKGLSLNLGATWQSHQDRRVGGGERIGPADYTSRAGDVKLLYAPDSDSEWMFNFQYMEQPNTPRVDELTTGFGQSHPGAEVFSFAPNARRFTHLRYRNHASWPIADQIELHIAQQRITDDRRNRDFGATIETRERNRSRLNGFTAQLDLELPDAHTLSYGLEVYRDSVFSSRLATSVLDGTRTSVRSRFPNGATMRSLAAYAFDEWQLASRWILSGGLRYSRFKTNIPADQIAARLQQDDITGNLSLAYSVSDSLNLVANVGRGFRPPNVFDLGTLGERPGNRFNIPNTALQPESLRSIDFGAKWASLGLQAELFGFFSQFDNKISTVRTGETTAGGRDIVTSTNVNQSRLYGIESGFRYFPDVPVEIFAVANWVRATERLANGVQEPADRVPPLNGRLGLRGHAWANVRVESWLGFSERQDRLSARDMRDVRIDPAGTGGWLSLNARVHWIISHQWEAGLWLGNLLDKRYREHGSGIDADGFNLALSLTWLH